MIRLLLVILTTCFLLACNNKDENSLLQLPPYKILTDSISDHPENADLYYRRGSLLYSNQLPDMAEQDLRKAWELQPKEEYAISVSMVVRHRSVDEAISFLENALKKLPSGIFIRIQLIQGYKSQNKFERALEICNDVIAMYPNNIDVYLLKAEILKNQDKTKEAISTLQKAYAFAPGDVELVHTLAFDYAETKNPGAITLSDSLISVDTEKSHAEPYFFKGVYYSNTGNYKEAIKNFDKAITTNHNFIDAYINKGIVYFDQKNYSEAIKVFQLANRVFPDDAYPYYWIAKTQQRTGDNEKAKLNYQKAFNLDRTLTNAKDSADKL